MRVFEKEVQQSFLGLTQRFFRVNGITRNRMNRKDFGKLLSTLRQDLDWTQFELSEYADIDEAVVSQIERGVKRHFEPELLFRLANALQLTTLERREFFLAASGLDQNQIVRQVSAGMA